MISAQFWKNRRVLLTGHTGFKGAWTALILRSVGAHVYGFALAPTGENDLFRMAKIQDDVHHIVGDTRDLAAVRNAFNVANPEIVLHLASQPIVRFSYADPVGTYSTNVMGAAHVLECARHRPEVRAVVIVTSDKCYENVGQLGGYQEDAQLGGHDPYSNSKACVELLTASFRRSFCADGSIKIATARAGNVIGGGDWAPHRLVPDAMRAFFSGSSLSIRNPHAVRPWQHVLDPVAGYLQLAERLVSQGTGFAEAWNFGPPSESEISVGELTDLLAREWGRGAQWVKVDGGPLHEDPVMKLDCRKAHSRLGWHSRMDLAQAVKLTSDWYQGLYRGADMRSLSLNQINEVLAIPYPAAEGEFA